MTNRLFKDIFLILIIGSLLGLAYNFYSNKLEWVRTEKPIITISEDELFGSEVNNSAENQLISKDTNKSIVSDTVKTEKPIKDTLITQNQVPEKPLGIPLAAEPEIKNIGYELFKKYINDKRMLVIDARSPEMYELGKIGNAINIFPLIEEKDEYFRTLSTLPKEKAIVIYCDGGDCDLSHHLANDLKNFGFTKIFLYVGGWEEWTKKGGV